MSALSPGLFLPLLGGALLCWKLIYTRYKFARRSGYEFFFMAGIAGIGLLAVCYVAITLIGSAWTPPNLATRIWGKLLLPDSPFLAACVLSFLAGWPSGWVLNHFFEGTTVRDNEIARHGDELERLISDAIKRTYTDPQLYMVTLDEGKVYIGLILSETNPYGNRVFLTLLKFGSGYRGDEHGVTIKTKYADLIRKVAKNTDHDDVPDYISVRDFEVMVPKEKILQVSPFEPDLRDHFPDGPEM